MMEALAEQLIEEAVQMLLKLPAERRQTIARRLAADTEATNADTQRQAAAAEALDASWPKPSPSTASAAQPAVPAPSAKPIGGAP